MIDIRYFLILLAWAILLIGFYYRNYPITTLGAILAIVLGIHIFAFGISIANTLLVTTLAWINILPGAYIVIRGALEQISNAEN